MSTPGDGPSDTDADGRRAAEAAHAEEPRAAEAAPRDDIGPSTTMPPTPDIEAIVGDPTLPGGHRGGFQRLPTAPIEVTTRSAPAEPVGDTAEPLVLWAMPEEAAPRRGLAAWALAFSIMGLLVAIFVGWGFPLGLVGIGAAVMALRRPLESRAIAWWAIALGAVSLVYSAGWLAIAASRANLFG